METLTVTLETLLKIACILMCLSIAYTVWTHRYIDDGGDSREGGDDPYNYDPDDPQDYWKKEGRKSF